MKALKFLQGVINDMLAPIKETIQNILKIIPSQVNESNILADRHYVDNITLTPNTFSTASGVRHYPESKEVPAAKNGTLYKVDHSGYAPFLVMGQNYNSKTSLFEKMIALTSVQDGNGAHRLILDIMTNGGAPAGRITIGSLDNGVVSILPDFPHRLAKSGSNLLVKNHEGKVLQTIAL